MKFDLSAWSLHQIQELYRSLQQISNIWGQCVTQNKQLESIGNLIDLSQIAALESELSTELSKRGALHSMKELSDRQKSILMFIHQYQNTHGCAPSIAEIKDGLNMSSTSVVKWHIDRLASRGWIKSHPKRARSIRLLRPIQSV